MKDSILNAVSLMERIIPRLKPSTRETIRRNQLVSIQQSLILVMKTLSEDCTSSIVLTHLMESVNLIDTVTGNPTFEETDAETKSLLIDRANMALSEMYMFAGKFYMTHHFTWAINRSEVLRNIVDYCIKNGFYFGYDKKLRSENVS